ncbi:MAG TPA: hypothetical protein VG454_07685 [Gemmatimonadales bacterium]|nr:hypothetical protein [Gemmatimonadales bacterium]
MRFVRVVLALVFSLAMAGPESHACPIHGGHQGVPASHHQSRNDHHKSSHCTCPQACCPAACTPALVVPPVIWSARIPAVRFFDADRAAPAPLLATRKHLLPPAIAPPHDGV